jgi:hypothetical protein
VTAGEEVVAVLRRRGAVYVVEELGRGGLVRTEYASLVTALNADARYRHRWRPVRAEDRTSSAVDPDVLYVVPA